MSCIKICLTTDEDEDGDGYGVTINYEVKSGIPAGRAQSETTYLTECLNITKPQDISLDELQQCSTQFPLKFPIEAVLCSTLLTNQPDVTREILEHHINSSYPLLHEAAFSLYMNFLDHKKKFGTHIEKALYKNMSVIDLVQRLLDNRAAIFCGSLDFYMLLSGEEGYGNWKTIGTEVEKAPLLLKDCISYDEVKLSAFLAATCHSVFINDGQRYNRGVPSPPENLERHGVVVGMVGPRLSAGEVMDWHEMVLTKEQNVLANGYGSVVTDDEKHNWRRIWADFYGVSNLPLYKEVLKLHENERVHQRYVKVSRERVFDNEIYAKRIYIAAELLLLEAASRAAAENRKAYVHVVGIGLGAWMLSAHQGQIFLDSFALCLKNLYPSLLHVSDINFAWFKENTCAGVEDGGFIGDSTHAIKIHFSKRTPHSKFKDPENVNKLLVVSYAWDGNSLPGNEYWDNSLTTSGDSANACSTQVSELQNPYVNRKKISGANLHIATTKWGVLHVAEYANRKLKM
ncbi:uncharacterized protein [Periplaneta americana]|uniref:uncharacterized protein isoform X1 n=1 Tax=Periplaneta americana TaxID=6978 RepID=UPI0037E8BE98